MPRKLSENPIQKVQKPSVVKTQPAPAGSVFSVRLPLWLVLLLCGSFGVGTYLILETAPLASSYSYTLPGLEEGTASNGFIRGVWPQLENSQFFEKTRENLLAQRASFIEANLSRMELTLYKDGSAVTKIPIVTKGRKGSWWETPAGLYKVESKEPSHFSSLGRVNMPWSMQFQGNFFIHGIPTHSDGSPVSTSYSGGCIRLHTADAKMIYDQVEKGIPVLVYETEKDSDTFSYQVNVPNISAQQYLAADIKNNFIFVEKDHNAVVQIGSLTKLIAALVTTQYVSLDKKVEITDSMMVPTQNPRLQPGDFYSVYDLLHLILRENSNEALEAISRVIGPKYFVNLMNKNSQSVGMQRTTLVNTSGTESGNTSTPEDLFNYLKYLYNNRSFILSLSAGKVTNAAYGNPAFTDISDNLDLVRIPGYVGGMVSVNNDGTQSALLVVERTFRGQKRQIGVVVFGSSNYKADISAILDYSASLYH